MFLKEQELEKRRLEHGHLVDAKAIPLPGDRKALGLTAVGFRDRPAVSGGLLSGILLVALGLHDILSGTPAHKSIAVRIRRSGAAPKATFDAPT